MTIKYTWNLCSTRVAILWFQKAINIQNSLKIKLFCNDQSANTLVSY